MCLNSGIVKLKTDLNFVQIVKRKTHEQNANWWIVFGVITLLTLCTRFYKVTEPDHVCWDETHFGKMASWYINRTFFFDVHPPLGKMLIALSGTLTGYDGTYPFEKPGDKYNGTRYEGMRIFCTAVGAAIGPMTYVTAYDLTDSVTAAALSALLIVFDVGLITLSQYILLDPLLFGAMSAAFMGAVKSSKRALSQQPAGGWLLVTGASLAAAISVKFVGLFIVLLVGVMTVRDLWEVLGDLSRPVMASIKHLFLRFVTLIMWPALLYMIFFYIHLKVLNRSGNGDGFYSSGFQSQLIGNSLHNAVMPRDVAVGAVVTFKNYRTGGGYLHSHQHLYPEGHGARQQQITTYTHKDDNNKWLMKTYFESKSNDVDATNEVEQDKEVRLLRHGDLVVLEHVATRRNLHSHREPAPLSKKLRQVTGYGENGTGDANDVWRLILDGGKEGDVLKAVTTKLRLVHYLQGCALTTTAKQLPKWGFEQQEVGCTANLRDPNAVWNVEENVFERLPSVSFQVYAPGFLERFLESHAVMLQGNAGLKPKEGEVTSRPWQWPINYRGQFFSGGKQKIYLLGNPVIWWGNLVILAIFLLLLLFVLVRRQRAFADADVSTEDQNIDKSLQACCWLFLGWFLHYAPFWAMGRVLYFHHYFPALIFNSMLSGILMSRFLDLVQNKISAWAKHIALGIILSVLVASFLAFSPLSYGMDGPSSSEPDSPMRHLRWMDTWEF